MPRNVEARFDTSTITESSGRLEAFAGSTPVAKMPMLVSTQAITYQRLRDSVVSAMGAHRNFQVCGSRPSATNPATCSTLRPAFDSR